MRANAAVLRVRRPARRSWLEEMVAVAGKTSRGDAMDQVVLRPLRFRANRGGAEPTVAEGITDSLGWRVMEVVPEDRYAEEVVAGAFGG